MSGEQTALPVPAEPTSGMCGWCDEVTSQKIVLAKGSLKTQANGIKVRQPDRWSWVCAGHQRSLGRS